MITSVIEAIYDDYLKAKFPNYDSRRDDLNTLAVFAQQYKDPFAFLDQLALLTNLESETEVGAAAKDTEAVNLSSVHQAKGLEFPHVFILRASSPSFPGAFHETLVEFPRELRDPDSVAQDDGKELHLQEERRLFYVAMTRARDSLTIYARRGTGKKDSTPPGFLRDLLKDSQLNRWLRSRPAHAFQTDLFGAAVIPIEASRTSQWL